MRQSDRAFQCFEENAFRYGFILSYPPGNDYLPGAETYEPWHWRYEGYWRRRTGEHYAAVLDKVNHMLGGSVGGSLNNVTDWGVTSLIAEIGLTLFDGHVRGQKRAQRNLRLSAFDNAEAGRLLKWERA